ncbi:hypothetical protein GGTG_02023 [Gaeumannomyces tritici R3-111a-1]|uniref:Uncharacterized protein n=1 Tax=Gaeumannomyces tritici (strain R3-111a-1) TaxID=644352 RepID=J3NL81_GAET3|nr:hypothetical protein GGTG_02023 [Gaeumannomyces tritici R3-111a-1]EJT82049.1 hypothetical protein GGTG_02023 [Gaeumannomyces tritici R3-111a-1]
MPQRFTRPNRPDEPPGYDRARAPPPDSGSSSAVAELGLLALRVCPPPRWCTGGGNPWLLSATLLWFKRRRFPREIPRVAPHF